MREFNLKIENALKVDSSAGNLLKWCIKDSNNNTLYIKTSTFNEYNSIWLYESYSELIVCRLLKDLGITNVVMYYPCKINLNNGVSTFGCYSKSFLGNNEKYISIANLVKTGKVIDTYSFEGYEGYERCIKDIGTVCGIDYRNELDKIIEVDYLTLNCDRHLGNLGFIYNYRTAKFNIAPIFDNGNALFSLKDISEMDYSTALDSYVTSKPFYNRHEMQVRMISEKIDFRYNIDKTLKYIDSLKSLGLDKHRAEFIKQLLKIRLKMLYDKNNSI